MSYELVFTTVAGAEIRYSFEKGQRDQIFEKLRATENWSTKTFHYNGTIINLAHVISVSKMDMR